MAVIVIKFGGSSLAGKQNVMNAAKIIAGLREEGYNVAAVVSAQGDTTDELIARTQEICDSPPKREMDILLSTGELMSAALVAMAACSIGCPAAALSGAQAGFVTDKLHGVARIERVETQSIKRHFDRGEAVIVAGFQGITDDGEVTTLGRGGSDTSAVALAAALGAKVCRIYTDVDGVYTADPRRVKGARKLAKVGYDDMLELSTLGAKVLHNRSVELAKKYGVTLEVLENSGKTPGTAVCESVGESAAVSGVAKDADVAAITLSGVTAEASAAYRVVSLLAQKRIPIDLILQSPPENGKQLLSFTVGIGDLAAARQAVQHAVKGTDWQVQINDSVAKVSVVGSGLHSRCTVAAETLGALYAQGIEVRSISSSEIKLTALVDRGDADRAEAAVHRAFFG